MMTYYIEIDTSNKEIFRMLSRDIFILHINMSSHLDRYFTMIGLGGNIASLRTFRVFRALKTISVVPGKATRP